MINCEEAVSKYKKRCRQESVGRLGDWEKTIHECTDDRVRSLKSRRINKRKEYVLKYTYNIVDYLNDLHETFVLVPADKAASNVIVVCKKYYHTVR